MKTRGFRVVPASSGKSTHVEAFLDLLDGKSVADAWTTSDDAEHSKPEPDLVRVALDRVDGASGVMIGDSPWDCVAAGKLDVPTIAVRTGGFSVAELTEAGAVRVFDSLRELREPRRHPLHPARPRGRLTWRPAGPAGCRAVESRPGP